MKRWSTSKGAKIRIKMPQRAIKWHEGDRKPNEVPSFGYKRHPQTLNKFGQQTQSNRVQSKEGEQTGN